MAVKIERPMVVQAAGTKPQRTEEFFVAEYLAVCLPAISPATVHRDS
jgi:hypothetical protein